jgi:glycerol-3-phosphate cytidylyltransferase-like family protein
MQEANGELTLLRIERIVNLENIALTKREMIDENEIEIALLKRDGESFTHELHRFESKDDLKKLKEEILKKYTDAKQKFIDEHDFDFFGMGDDFQETEVNEVNATKPQYKENDP